MKEPLSYETEYPLLPVRGTVLFPTSVVPFEIGRAKTVALAEHLGALTATQGKETFIVAFAQKDPTVEDPSQEDLHEVGTLGRVLGVAKHGADRFAIVIEGIARVRLGELTQTSPFVKAKVLPFEGAPVAQPDSELDALGLTLKDLTRELIKLLPALPREVGTQLDAITDPVMLADVVAAYLEAKVEEKAALLEQPDPKERVRAVVALVAKRIETLKVREKINAQVKDEIGKTQREHVLRQQLKAIKEELEGEDADDGDDAIEELTKRVEAAKLSDEARDVAKKQLKRLKQMQPGSPEHGMVRTYLDWILDLPWTEASADATELAKVREVLEADHYGLEKVKKRILEFLAVRKLKNDKKGPILCLIGPPGVGKTSLAKSIARALDRKLHRISLGGVHDEAAIRGHRRTYIGSLPGQIIQGMKKVGTTNPVFVLDEIDKLGRDFRGDPASALLEVLDPEQNNTFADHYLEIPYDLSNVLFIATANQADTIPAPLRDRMEVIEIAGYTRKEKLAIARRHLVPKQIKEHGITDAELAITDEALEAIIEKYTREAGVRSLERQIAAVVRGVVIEVAEKGTQEKRTVGTLEEVRVLLGPPKFESEVAERTEDPGVATGLAWTPVGGEILFVEATRMPGRGELTLTGQLGDVMKESARAALSYVRANADKFGIAQGTLEKSDLHVHVPAGAMPKDGPSAGVTMLTAIVSQLTGIRVRHDVAMTGEITLRGRVLPIGGVKEKVLAAHRAGIKRIVLPARNAADLEEVPAEVRAELEFVPVDKMEEVLVAALEKMPAPLPIAPPRAPAAPTTPFSPAASPA